MITLSRTDPNWEIGTGAIQFTCNDTQFIEYIWNLSIQGLDHNNIEQLQAVLHGYNMLEEKLGYYFVRNRRDVDRRRRAIIIRLNNLNRYVSSNDQTECHAFCFCQKGQ